MRRFNLIIYGLFGVSAIIFGIAHLLFPGTLFSEAARSFSFSHILREQAAAVIFIGLMSWWCIINYDRRQLVHVFLMVFAFLLAAIHWFDFLTGHLNWMSPLYNTVPFLVLLFMALTGEFRHPKPLERL
jgi:Domain of unknown function (DUF4345)